MLIIESKNYLKPVFYIYWEKQTCNVIAYYSQYSNTILSGFKSEKMAGEFGFFKKNINIAICKERPSYYSFAGYKYIKTKLNANNRKK